jgi:hypothetical protein
MAEYPPVPLVFREDRWRDAGATDAQVSTLFTKWNDLSVDDRWAENERIAGLSNGDLAAELATTSAPAGNGGSTPQPPSTTSATTPPSTPGNTPPSGS